MPRPGSRRLPGLQQIAGAHRLVPYLPSNANKPIPLGTYI
jgi:hypothetical protein